MTAGEEFPEMGQWIKDLATGRRTFADRLADRQSMKIPSQDPDYGDLGRAFSAWSGPPRAPILQPPKPEMTPSRGSFTAPWTARPTGRPPIDHMATPRR